MYYSVTIPDDNGRLITFGLYFNQYREKQRIEVKDVCIIDITKEHDHRYDLKAFFYKKKHITYRECIRSKKELYCAIQLLLKQNLYDVVQQYLGRIDY